MVKSKFAMTYRDIYLPDGLTEQVKDYITSVIDWLAKESKLESTDGMAIYTLAESYNTYLLAQETVKDQGLTIPGAHGGVTTNPAVKIARDAKLDAIAIARDFGLTLASRGRIKETAKAVEPSPLQMLINQSN